MPQWWTCTVPIFGLQNKKPIIYITIATPITHATSIYSASSTESQHDCWIAFVEILMLSKFWILHITCLVTLPNGCCCISIVYWRCCDHHWFLVTPWCVIRLTVLLYLTLSLCVIYFNMVIFLLIFSTNQCIIQDISQLKTRLARLIDSKFVPVAAACSISACWCLASTKRLGHC